MVEIVPISIPKAAVVLANSLREQILDGRIPEGQTLPNERDLAARAGLSRPSVREALRILEVEGLVVTRPGRTGGAEVVRPDVSMIQRSMETFIRGQGIRLQSVLQAREAVEPQAARLAASHWNDEDWAALEESHERLLNELGDVPRFLKANFDWHQAVVRASHNELLIAFISSIAQPLYAATDLRGFNSPEVRKAVGVAHGKVMDALRVRDADAAWRRMGRHVGAYHASVAQRAQQEQQPEQPELSPETLASAAP
jgi:GntR family transcriptional repressor for pyruvate dehydrogenase complex